MKLSRLALAAALAAVWAALPLAARADEGDRDSDEETVEIQRRVRRDDREGGREREGAPRERRDMDGREGRDGPRGMRDRDPEMRAKLEKLQELEDKAREEARSARQGSDAEKAAAKAALRKTLGELFDAKLALESAVLEKMERQAAELKARIAKKKSSRDKAIENRLVRMTGEGDDW